MGSSLEEDILNDEGVPALWTRGFRGAGITAAVVDTGVNAGALSGRVLTQDVFSSAAALTDAIGHGTHMSEILLRYAPDARIASLKVVDGAGLVTRETVIAALDHSTAHYPTVRLFNMSLGIRRRSFGRVTCTQSAPCLLCRKVNALAEGGRILVAAAGNDGPGPDTITCPGMAAGAYTIGATVRPVQEEEKWGDAFLKRALPAAYYHRHGMDVGTSIAAARVTGGIALLLSAFPAAALPDLREAFAKTAVAIQGPANAVGAGLLHLYRAYKWLDHRRAGKTLDPSQAQSLYKAGRAAEKDAAASLEKYDQAAELDPTNATYAWAIGTTLLIQKKFDEAETWLADTVGLSWRLGMAHFNLGIALEAQGKMEDAIRHYRIAYRWDPKRPEILAGLQRFQ